MARSLDGYDSIRRGNHTLKQVVFGIFLFLAVPAWSATIRDFCKDTGDPDFPCTFSSLEAAEAAAAAGDILEGRDSDEYDNNWVPGGERTLRNKAGDCFTIKPALGRAVDFADAGVGPVSILSDPSDPLGCITLDANNGSTLRVTAASGAITWVMNRVHILNSKVNLSLALITNAGDNMTGIFTKCLWGRATGGAGTGFEVTAMGSASVWTFENNYFHDIESSAFVIEDDHGSGNIPLVLKGVTIRNCGVGIESASRVSAKHVLLQDNVDDFLESGTFVKTDFSFSGFEQEPKTGWPASIKNGSSVFQGISDSITGYRLVNASFGINDGDTTGIADDIEGTSRPQNTNFDFGAFEALAIMAGATNMITAGVVQNVVAAGVNQKIVD